MGIFDSLSKNKETRKPIPQQSMSSLGNLPVPPPLHDSREEAEPPFSLNSLPPPPMQTNPSPFAFENPGFSQVPISMPKPFTDNPIPKAEPIAPPPKNDEKSIDPPRQSFQMNSFRSNPAVYEKNESSQIQKESPPSFDAFEPVSFKDMPKAAPNELPAFPTPKFSERPSFSVPKSTSGQIGKANDDSIGIPEPPPNLRSEISPLELEKLESKYLNKHPQLKDVEEPFSYSRHQKPTKPIFVKTDNYRQMLNNFIDIKDQLTESEEIIFRLENLKKNMDMEYLEYKKSLEDMQRKFIYIDKTLFND